MKKNLTALLLAALLVLACTACAGTGLSSSAGESAAQSTDAGTSSASASQSGSEQVTTAVSGNASGAIDASDLFTERDLLQTPDLSEAETVTVQSGADVSITSAGVYVLQGTAEDVTVTVDAGDDDKVQLVLDGLSLTNADFPCIYVKNADKVFITTADGSENSLAVTGSFRADGSANTDAVIYSKDDLVLNGLGTLTISSTDNGVSCKDDLKITGGTLTVSCVSDALEANDSIAVAGGAVTVSSQKDGLHAENDDDNTLGWIYICGGTLEITARDDAVHATTIFQMDGGTLVLNAAEGIEATWVQINDGTLDISASDDGINGGRKSSAYSVKIEINGGSLTIVMGSGDTDGIDSNGDLVITGGTVDVTAQSPFDYDGTATYTGGTIIVNGVETNEITSQTFGGMGGPGGMGGGSHG